MIPLVFPGNLLNTYYSWKITSIVIMVLYILTVDVIIIYSEPILCWGGHIIELYKTIKKIGENAYVVDLPNIWE